MTKELKVKCQWMKPAAMEQDGPINFKALRARFQEEAALAQARTSRPAVAEKPRKVHPLGGHRGVSVESKAVPAAPRDIFRDGLRSSGGKRPISFPPQPQSPQPISTDNGGGMSPRRWLRDRCVAPLVSKTEQNKTESLERQKEVVPLVKVKKKGLLLPFKSAKAAKAKAEPGEPPYADLASGPAGELSSADTHSAEDGSSAQGEQSTSEYPTSEYPTSSPDAPLPTPPPQEDTSGDWDRRPSASTLERAKKKLLCHHFLLYGSAGKARGPCPPDGGLSGSAPPLEGAVVERDVALASPLSLPHLACVSARPFSKTSSSGLRCQEGQDKKIFSHRAPVCPVRHVRPPTPPKKPMPDLRSLGPWPVKPPRPPCVDLSHYCATTVQEASSGRQPLPEQQQPPLPNPAVEPPDFPDFENSAEGEPIDIAALALEALEMVSFDCPPAPAEAFGIPEAELSSEAPSFDLQGLNLARQDLILLDPAAFPGPLDLFELPEPLAPESWPPGHQGAAQASEACQVVMDEHEVGEAALNNGTKMQQCMCPHDVYYDTCDNVYEDVEAGNKFGGSQNSRKRKGGLKNPYAESLPMREDARLNKWSRHPWGSLSLDHGHVNPTHCHSSMKGRHSPDVADYKERKKREKQRLEKEKKEQKEREKKENEMKKKFKVTGQEEPIYHAKVTVASKVRKHDLPVRSGDTVGIIRTTSCPKGKWLARDANHKYGYISVMNVELNIQEMLELGQKAQAGGRGAAADTVSTGSRSSNHPVLTSSFTDDSEEWAVEDETVSPSMESHSFHQHADAKPEMLCGHAGVQHTLGDVNPQDLHTQSRHEALQKLAIFFQNGRGDDPEKDSEPTPTNVEQPSFLHAVEEPSFPEQEVDFMDMAFLPPPPLYADSF